MDTGGEEVFSSTGGQAIELDAPAAVSATFCVLGVVAFSQLIFCKARGPLAEVAMFCAVRGAAFVSRAVAESRPRQAVFALFDALLAAGFYLLVSVLFSIHAKWSQQRLEHVPLLSFESRLAQAVRCLSQPARLAGLLCAICAVIGSVKTFADGALPSDMAIGHQVRELSALGYLALSTALLLVSLALLAVSIHWMAAVPCTQSHPVMEALTLTACSFLLELKAVFLMVGALQPDVAYDQLYFYPLSVLPEILIVTILVFPGSMANLTGIAASGLQLPDSLAAPPQAAKYLLNSQQSWSSPHTEVRSQLLSGMYAV